MKKQPVLTPQSTPVLHQYYSTGGTKILQRAARRNLILHADNKLTSNCRSEEIQELSPVETNANSPTNPEECETYEHPHPKFTHQHNHWYF